MYSPQPVDFSSVKQPIVLRQWIQEIFDFRFLICDFFSGFAETRQIQSAIENQQSKIKNHFSSIASKTGSVFEHPFVRTSSVP